MPPPKTSSSTPSAAKPAAKSTVAVTAKAPAVAAAPAPAPAAPAKAAPSSEGTGDYDALVNQLDALNGKNDATSVTQRAALAKQMADILAARRKTDRFQCFVSMTVEAPGGSGNGTLTNIGSGGGYLKTTVALEKFTEVKLTVRLAGRLPVGLVFPVQIRWVKPNDGAGVAFTELGAAEATAVKKMLAELVKEQPPLART